jgi:hypothetical protein
MKRREFLHCLIGLSTVPHAVPALLQQWENEDILICNRKFELALAQGLQRLPIGEVIVEMGKSFLGSRYAANTLDRDGEERLVVNLRRFDCVSLCETVLALARCVKMQKTSFEEYRHQLQLIRYRGGVISRYPSRLHYFTDWIFDNEKKNVLRNVTQSLGGEPYRKKINFMSTHTDSYRQLRENPEFVTVIKQQEVEISTRKQYFIPKQKLRLLEEKIESGDLLALTTTIEGLDIAHTGIALQQHGRLHMLHAPDVDLRVRITDLPLVEYLASYKRMSGLIVARAQEPV